jgi:glyoxylase-like metal-dependent hydrolase (beta-lactamase superfamily II)
MNKIFKRVLIIAAIIIGVSALITGGVFLKIKSAQSTLNPMETGKLADNIFVVGDGYGNMFIVQDSVQYIGIDCGMFPDAVEEQLKKLGISPNDVVAVFLTHTDADHVGALHLFGKARLYMSKEEELMITGKKSKIMWIKNSISRTDYTLLEDREVIQTGNLKIESILAPGHTSGMMAYLVNDKYLFTGDILSLKDGKIAPIPSIYNMDTKQAVKSMEIIRHIPSAGYIFTSHWGYTDDYRTAVQKTD